MAKRRNWTEAENATLREMWPTIGPGKIAEVLSRSAQSVKSHAAELGLPRKTISIGWRSSQAGAHEVATIEREASDTHPMRYVGCGRWVRFVGSSNFPRVSVHCGTEVLLTDLAPRTDLVDVNGGRLDWWTPQGAGQTAVAIIAYCCPDQRVVSRLYPEFSKTFIGCGLLLNVVGDQVAAWIAERVRPRKRAALREAC